MSSDQIRRILTQLDKDISELSKKSADYGKRAAEARGKATHVSIPKNASLSTMRARQSQIGRYENDADKASASKADVDKKLADKQKKRSDTFAKLQKEEAADRKKERNVQSVIQRRYEKRIEELSTHMSTQTPPSFSLQPSTLSIKNKPITSETLERYDVFIFHAWEDKETFVNELVDELKSLGVSVWYDKHRIAWGDSMRAKIDEGLGKSKFGVVVISPNYIADGKYWTKAELDGLFQLESVNGKTILPIWHNITKKEVLAYSPLIAGRLAMTTADLTPKKIAEEFFKLLPTAEAQDSTESMEDVSHE